MLESNTDRSYFMIGAVVLAGIIIAAAVYIFDTQIFGETGILTETFGELTGTAKESMKNIAKPKAPGVKGDTIVDLANRLMIGVQMLGM